MYAGPVIVDIDPPFIESVVAETDSTLLINFNESLDKTSAETTNNYIVDKNITVVKYRLRYLT